MQMYAFDFQYRCFQPGLVLAGDPVFWHGVSNIGDCLSLNPETSPRSNFTARDGHRIRLSGIAKWRQNVSTRTHASVI